MRLKQYLLRPVAYLAGLHASGQVKQFLQAHQRTDEVQQQLLQELLDAHRSTQFGRDHGFDKIRTYADFAAAVPVGSYETLRPYMQKVFNGETTAMLPPGEPVLMFAQTSGTTGEPKCIPVTRRFLAEVRRGWNVWGLLALRDHPHAWMRPILQISSSMREAVSPTGLPCGAISGLLAATQKTVVRRMYVVPTFVSELSDATGRFYTALRCGVGRDVSVITTANPSSMLKLFEIGQAHLEGLLKDVHDGTITPPGNANEAILLRLRFSPAPAVAKRLEHDVARDGRLLPRHLWNLGFLGHWTGGTLGLYLPRLRELFGDVPIRDVGLLASEGRFSVPLADGTPAGVADILTAFLEFIPVEEANAAAPRALRAHELEVGQEYFVVVTNWAGLWRYNMDDRVRVTDRLGDSPVFEFLSRGLYTANITGEKITENQVVRAMAAASRQTGLGVERFVLQGVFADVPFYQLRVQDVSMPDAFRLAAAMDASLAELNCEYLSKRHSGRLGVIQPQLMESGTLERTEAQKIAARRGRAEQYKHQYLLVDVLASN